jgi:uncharacterized protein YndB with AHSA1/START domain
MIQVVREAHVGAPPSKVWPLVSEVERLPEWFALAERAELLEGSGKGRRQRMHGHWGGKPSEVDQLVTGFDPERAIAWEHEAERLAGRPAPRFAASTRFTISLSPEGRGTRVRLDSAQEPAGALKGLVMRLMGTRELARNLDTSLERLAALARVPT